MDRPDEVASSSPRPSFDADDYALLRKHYLERLVTAKTLPSLTRNMSEDSIEAETRSVDNNVSGIRTFVGDVDEEAKKSEARQSSILATTCNNERWCAKCGDPCQNVKFPPQRLDGSSYTVPFDTYCGHKRWLYKLVNCDRCGWNGPCPDFCSYMCGCNRKLKKCLDCHWWVCEFCQTHTTKELYESIRNNVRTD